MKRCVSLALSTTLHSDRAELKEARSAQAVEVYEKLVRADPEDPPDLVIGGSSLSLPLSTLRSLR